MVRLQSGSETNIVNKTQIEAEEHKIKGNSFFKEGNFIDALSEYNLAIELYPSNAVFYSNRAFVYLKTEAYGAAITDSEKSIDLGYKKGYYRRGSAYLALGKFDNALKDFKMLAKYFPNDKDARKKLKACKEASLREKFYKAIQSEASVPVSLTVKLSDFSISDSYDGVIMPEKLTLDSVHQMIECFREQKLIHKKFAYQIVLDALKILSSLPTLVDVSISKGCHFTVCGDIHGQFYDLLNIFNLNGYPSPSNPYLFNGDFVDRGSFSAECILTLFAFKILYPNHLHLTRGNHETINMNQIYGFKGEIISKYDEKLFHLFTEVFQWLPLGYCLGKKVLVVHGGLFSRDGVTLEDIRQLKRNREPPETGIMCEILWSDPSVINGRSPNKRGIGVSFGPDVITQFCEENNLDLIVRSHEVKDEGYMFEPNMKLVTVFSAPNYCDIMGNKGAFIRFEDDYKPKITSFDHVPHPDIKPMKYAMNMFGI